MASQELVTFLSDYLPRHPDVKAQLDALAGEQLLEAAVAASAKAGCGFTADEFRAAMRAAAAMKSGGELSEDQLQGVAGGRKAGGGQHEYLVVKLNDVFISSVHPSGQT
jgi:hypothetical protein